MSSGRYISQREGDKKDRETTIVTIGEQAYQTIYSSGCH
jgi:hypothetical protein